MIFLKDFYDPAGRVNTGNKWVWGVHLVCYSYVAVIYLGTDARVKEESDASKMWIPLDMILTVLIAIYQVYYNRQ